LHKELRSTMEPALKDVMVGPGRLDEIRRQRDKKLGRWTV
jgi:hypothetical protein